MASDAGCQHGAGVAGQQQRPSLVEPLTVITGPLADHTEAVLREALGHVLTPTPGRARSPSPSPSTMSSPSTSPTTKPSRLPGCGETGRGPKGSTGRVGDVVLYARTGSSERLDTAPDRLQPAAPRREEGTDVLAISSATRPTRRQPHVTPLHGNAIRVRCRDGGDRAHRNRHRLRAHRRGRRTPRPPRRRRCRCLDTDLTPPVEKPAETAAEVCRVRCSSAPFLPAHTGVSTCAYIALSRVNGRQRHRGPGGRSDCPVCT